MKLIKGMLCRHIFQIIIHTAIVMASFVFLSISFFLGCEVNSIIGIGSIIFAVLFVYMVVSTAFKIQIIIDRDVWKSLYKIGILRQESKKIIRIIDFIFLGISVPLSLLIGNSLIRTYLYPRKELWLQNIIGIFIEVFLVWIAYEMQIRFLEQCYEQRQDQKNKK